MMAAHFPSAATVGAWGWIAVGAYLLWLLGSGAVKVVLTARRERALTEEFRQRTRQAIEERCSRDDD